MIKKIHKKIRQNPLSAMGICCALPLIAFFVLSFLGVLGSWGFYALILICPLAHLWMMRGMFRSREDSKAQPGYKKIEGP